MSMEVGSAQFYYKVLTVETSWSDTDDSIHTNSKSDSQGHWGLCADHKQCYSSAGVHVAPERPVRQA